MYYRIIRYVLYVLKYKCKCIILIIDKYGKIDKYGNDNKMVLMITNLCSIKKN